MNRKIFVVVVSVLVGILAMIDYNNAITMKSPVTLFMSASADNIAIANIEDANGNVLLKGLKCPDYCPISKGTNLYPGDLLWPAAGVKVTIRCSNGNILPVPADEPSGVSNLCPTPPPGKGGDTVDPLVKPLTIENRIK